MNQKTLNIIIIGLILYLIYQIRCIKKEQFSYQEPTQAIKNLGKLAKQLTTGGLTIPGNVNITGELNVNKAINAEGGFAQLSSTTINNKKVGALYLLNGFGEGSRWQTIRAVPGYKSRIFVENLYSSGEVQAGDGKVLLDGNDSNCGRIVFYNRSTEKTRRKNAHAEIRIDKSFYNNRSLLVADQGFQIDNGLEVYGSTDGSSNTLTLGGGLTIKNGTAVINRSDSYYGLDVRAPVHIKKLLTLDDNLYVKGNAGISAEPDSNTTLKINGSGKDYSLVTLEAKSDLDKQVKIEGNLYVKGNVGIKSEPNRSDPLTINGDARVNNLSADYIWSYGNIEAAGTIEAKK